MCRAVRVGVLHKGKIKINRIDVQKAIIQHPVLSAFHMKLGRNPTVNGERNAFDKFFGRINNVASGRENLTPPVKLKRMLERDRFL